MSFGWNLPPGVTDRMIEEHFGGDDENEGCQNPGRHCKCEECQDAMADILYDEARDRELEEQ